ncbi:MAG: hypothetical protein IIW10_06940 [Spirochaetaceae bacterium]|nr:hypothetical protein [Spirochaetaceae bacterium]
MAFVAVLPPRKPVRVFERSPSCVWKRTIRKIRIVAFSCLAFVAVLPPTKSVRIFERLAILCAETNYSKNSNSCLHKSVTYHGLIANE